MDLEFEIRADSGMQRNKNSSNSQDFHVIQVTNTQATNTTDITIGQIHPMQVSAPMPRTMISVFLMSALVMSAFSATSFFSSSAQAQVYPTPTRKPSTQPVKKQAAAPKNQRIALNVSAKKLFKGVKTSANLPPAVYGTYTRGCLAGAKRIEANGPAWQVMRLSRNRYWGHPLTITLVKRLAIEAQRYDGWPGLLVGDISMPRGGPMPPSHRSHQLGLDADIWLTPMPNRKLSYRERERTSATFMLTRNHLAVNPKVWTASRLRLIKRAASYPEVERIFVHPAIKKELCRKAGSDRGWLSKVRPTWGHNYHFHIRLGCPYGDTACRRQARPRNDDGCGKELDRWYKRLHARLKPRPKRPPPKKPVKRRKPRPPITLAQLPTQCRTVIAAGSGGVVAPKPTPAARTSR